MLWGIGYAIASARDGIAASTSRGPCWANRTAAERGALDPPRVDWERQQNTMHVPTWGKPRVRRVFMRPDAFSASNVY